MQLAGLEWFWRLLMEPRKLLTMMDGIDELSPSELKQLTWAVDEMERNPKAVVIGQEKLDLSAQFSG